MGPQMFCQSCTFPIDNLEDRGTERDGSKSELYCKYCYKDSAFTDPGITLERMKDIAMTEMKAQNLPEHIIQQSLNMLPRLSRWQASQAENHVLL